MSDDANDGTTSLEDRRKRRQHKNAFAQMKALLSRKELGRTVQITEDHILSILIARRARHSEFGPDLFSEPAWDVLLELHAAALGARKLSLADLARAIDTPESTTARWVAVLADRGLVSSDDDMAQPGRRWISLTPEGASKMKRLAGHWGAAFLSI